MEGRVTSNPLLGPDGEPVSARSSSRLLSVSSILLAVTHTPATNYADRSFVVYGPRVWNSLPDELGVFYFSRLLSGSKLLPNLLFIYCSHYRVIWS